MSETPDPTRLMELAKAATPGPWTLAFSSNGGKILRRGPEQPLKDRHPQSHLQIVPDADALHIATFNPDAVVALLTLLADLQAENARLTAALQAVAEPVAYLRAEAEREGRTPENGYMFDGAAAINIASDAQFLRRLARAALTPKGETI